MCGLPFSSFLAFSLAGPQPNPFQPPLPSPWDEELAPVL
jgi:hypothetical protein